MALHSVLLEDEVILSIDGAFDAALTPEYDRAIETAFAADVRRMVLDFTLATAVDAVAAAALTETVAGCAARGTYLVLAMPAGVEAEVTDPAQVKPLLNGFEPWQDAG
ncbi:MULTISPECIES: STAS domain-containing protein [unclassified Amycolatopsis]|uniref:STAS domain-containing protein n=1 Tax=unclassified Amycolatopsis TaxID=2618356 RepID=UPI002E1ABCD2|nr:MULTISPECIES: STAS domain-containing protein [unclassified Amycolatopsis]